MDQEIKNLRLQIRALDTTYLDEIKKNHQLTINIIALQDRVKELEEQLKINSAPVIIPAAANDNDTPEAA